MGDGRMEMGFVGGRKALSAMVTAIVGCAASRGSCSEVKRQEGCVNCERRYVWGVSVGYEAWLVLW